MADAQIEVIGVAWDAGAWVSSLEDLAQGELLRAVWNESELLESDPKDSDR